MKLKNKKTGKIKECVVIPVDSNGYPNEYQVFEKGESLAELNEEWEDYEEPKDFWYINDFMVMCGTEGEFTTSGLAAFTRRDIERLKQIGNYFETKEEAEKAVEKLKAWKRLKDAGFKFNNWIYDYREAENENERGLSIGASYNQLSKIDADDINLLFGGEE